VRRQAVRQSAERLTFDAEALVRPACDLVALVVRELGRDGGYKGGAVSIWGVWAGPATQAGRQGGLN